MESNCEQLVLQLHDIDAIKFGSFQLKTGLLSPIYFDLRVIISYPQTLVTASERVWEILQKLNYDSICGVPYTALPIASCVTTTHNVKMLLKRKEAKSYGTKKIIEGCYKKGERCVIIEDVVTSGGSVLETSACLQKEGIIVTDVICLLDRKQGARHNLEKNGIIIDCLQKEGIIVTDVICLLDRKQGARHNIEKNGINLHSVLTIDEILSVLESHKKIGSSQVLAVNTFISSNQVENNSVVDPVEDIVLRLHEIGSFRFGSFKLSNGMITPIYVDLRLVISHPNLMSDICKQLYKVVEDDVKFDIICGVPLAALHLATCVAKDQELTNILLRSQAKSYGTGKLIEGVYKRGQKCLVVEDVIVSGQGIYEACQGLKSQGLDASDAIVVLDREQNGRENLEKLGVKLHCLVRISDALDILVRHKKINSEIAEEVKEFLRSNPATIPLTRLKTSKRTSQINQLMTFEERSRLCSNHVSKKLLEIMANKKTNLCVSADVTNMAALLQIAEEVGDHICLLKTHMDIINDFTMKDIEQLQRLALQHNFLIFEDRKFSDIGSTVKEQYAGGIHHIADWSDVITSHSLPGPAIVSALKQVGADRRRACVLVAEMSSKGNLANASYSVATVNMAKEHSDFVIGFISQSKLTSDPTILHMTPGVSLVSKADGLGQQYVSPSEAVSLRGADIIIVGRGIVQAENIGLAAKQYKEAGYDAYKAAREQQLSSDS